MRNKAVLIRIALVWLPGWRVGTTGRLRSNSSRKYSSVAPVPTCAINISRGLCKWVIVIGGTDTSVKNEFLFLFPCLCLSRMRTNTGCSSAILKQSSQMCFYAPWVTYENHNWCDLSHPSLVVHCLYPQSFWNLTVFKLHHLLLKGLSPNDCNFGVFCQDYAKHVTRRRFKTELRLMGYCATGLIVKYFSLWYR